VCVFSMISAREALRYSLLGMMRPTLVVRLKA